MALCVAAAVVGAALGEEAEDYKGKGAGTCSYTNPFTQAATCVQLTGSAYEDEAVAKGFCDAPGLPGAVGEFVKGATCDAFDDENFGGVCVNGEGTESETASAFIEVPGNPLATCEVTVQGCKQFGGGLWRSAGGKCKDGSEAEEAPMAANETEAATNDTTIVGDAVPCCMAATSECLACGAGVTEAEYCEQNPDAVGCEDLGMEEGEGAPASGDDGRRKLRMVVSNMMA